MVRLHHQLNGHEFEQTLGDSGGQGSLVCYSPWGSQRVEHDLAIEEQQAVGMLIIGSVTSKPFDGSLGHPTR